MKKKHDKKNLMSLKKPANSHFRWKSWPLVHRNENLNPLVPLAQQLKIRQLALAEFCRLNLIWAGHFLYFLIFSLIENDFLHFYQVNLTGSGLFK